MVKNKVLTDVATGLSSFTHTFCFYLQMLDRNKGNSDTSEGEQEPEVWEAVPMEDLRCDVESREPCISTMACLFFPYVPVSMQAQ